MGGTRIMSIGMLMYASLFIGTIAGVIMGLIIKWLVDRK